MSRKPRWITKVRSSIVDAIQSEVPEKDVCVLLSGGGDSSVVGFACHYLGKNVTAVSYELKGHPNVDCEQAKQTATIMGWKFVKVIVPTNDPSGWFKRLVLDYGCELKTEVEVLYPFIFLANRIKQLGFDKVLTGFSSPLPDGRKGTILARTDIKKFWKVREERSVSFRATGKCIAYGDSIGVQVIQPLNEPTVSRSMSTLKYSDIHKPYFKSPWKLPFLDEFEKTGRLEQKKNLTLQHGGGIEEFFSQVLNDPTINFRKYKKGSVKNRLVQLVRLWSKQSVKKNQSDQVIKFTPYSIKDVHKQSSKNLFTVVSTFAGGGGSSTGYKLAGGQVVFANEFIPSAVETYQSNYPDTPVEQVDIRKLNRRKKYVTDIFRKYGIEKGSLDILDGSPPCSNFSTAGQGKKKILEKGVKYSDTTQDRIGMLIHDYVFMSNVIQPKICIIENVPAIKSSDVFQHAMERLRRWGYLVNYQILTSSHFGVPQRRKRLFVVAVRPDIAKSVGLKSESEIRDIYPLGSSQEPTVKDAIGDLIPDRQEVNLLRTTMIKSSTYDLVRSLPKNPSKIIGMSHNDPTWTSDFNLRRSSWDHPCPTITQMGQQIGQAGILHPSDDRFFTTMELKRLQGLPDDFNLRGNFNQRAERVGRMVPPLMTKHLATSIYVNILSKVKDN
jgi:DNA-cytosine methyltransferase